MLTERTVDDAPGVEAAPDALAVNLDDRVAADHRERDRRLRKHATTVSDLQIDVCAW